MNLVKTESTGYSNQELDNKVSVFSDIVKQFVLNTIGMVKNNIREEEYIIEDMLTLLNNKLNQIYVKNDDPRQKTLPAVGSQTKAIKKIEQAVQQLSKQSENISERLFDLSQSLIQKRIAKFEEERKQIENTYEYKLIRLKSQYENEKIVMQSQLRQYKQKCAILEQCLEERSDFLKQQIEKQEQSRKYQLAKYLQIIQQIYQQLQVLKNFSVRQSINEVEGSYDPPYQNKYPDNYSQQYYNVRKDDRSTQIGAPTKKMYSPPHYNYQYYNQVQRYPSRQQSQVEQNQIICIDRRSNSKNKDIQSKYIRIAPRRENYYFQNDNRERSHSSEKQRREKRDSNYKTRPIILHYPNQILQTQSNPLKDSEVYTKRSMKLPCNADEFKRIEQKNKRMEGVEQKLFGLKRKLCRELKTMKN